MMGLTETQIEELRATPLADVFEMFVGMFPPGFVYQLDTVLLRVSPESVFQLPSAGTVHPVIKEITIKALYWRKDQLVKSAGSN